MISIASILNKHKKGDLFLGIKNDGTPNQFEIKDSTVRDVSRKIFESIKPQIFPSVRIEEIDGVEVIHVAFEGSDIPYSAFGRYYIRIADEDRELTPTELRRLMIGKEYEDHWENKLSIETAEDVDVENLKSFYDKAVKCGRLPEFSFSVDGILKQLYLLRDGKLTNAGRVLFSKNKPVTLKMAVFATEHKETFLDICREEGNLFQLIDVAVKYVVRNIRWRVVLNPDGIHRDEIPEIPIEAVREAVINSFVHARYDIPVQHEVDIYSNRIAFVNPGSFASEYAPADYAKWDLPSALRNEVIAQVLYRCKDVESFGSGLRKIYSACEQQKVAVTYENHESYFCLALSRMDRNIAPSDAINGAINGAISEQEAAVLGILMRNGNATMNEIAVELGKFPRTVNRLCSALKSKQLIERIGSNKTGYWKTK